MSQRPQLTVTVHRVAYTKAKLHQSTAFVVLARKDLEGIGLGQIPSIPRVKLYVRESVNEFLLRNFGPRRRGALESPLLLLPSTQLHCKRNFVWQSTGSRITKRISTVRRRHELRFIYVTCAYNMETDKINKGADIARSIKAQRIKLLGHIQRMDQARPNRKLLDWKPMGIRPVGRPRQRWQEDVMEDLKTPKS